jgi:hypothetical protein
LGAEFAKYAAPISNLVHKPVLKPVQTKIYGGKRKRRKFVSKKQVTPTAAINSQAIVKTVGHKSNVVAIPALPKWSAATKKAIYNHCKEAQEFIALNIGEISAALDPGEYLNDRSIDYLLNLFCPPRFAGEPERTANLSTTTNYLSFVRFV